MIKIECDNPKCLRPIESNMCLTLAGLLSPEIYAEKEEKHFCGPKCLAQWLKNEDKNG